MGLGQLRDPDEIGAGRRRGCGGSGQGGRVRYGRARPIKRGRQSQAVSRRLQGQEFVGQRSVFRQFGLQRRLLLSERIDGKVLDLDQLIDHLAKVNAVPQSPE